MISKACLHPIFACWSQKFLDGLAHLLMQRAASGEVWRRVGAGALKPIMVCPQMKKRCFCHQLLTPIEEEMSFLHPGSESSCNQIFWSLFWGALTSLLFIATSCCFAHGYFVGFPQQHRPAPYRHWEL